MIILHIRKKQTNPNHQLMILANSRGNQLDYPPAMNHGWEIAVHSEKQSTDEYVCLPVSSRETYLLLTFSTFFNIAMGN